MKNGMVKLLNAATKSSGTKEIYFVKCEQVFCRLEAGITSKNTISLCAFEDYNDAVEYVKIAHDTLVSSNTENNYFRILITQEPEIPIPDKNGNVILWKRITKLIGNDDYHKSQTKLFVFFIERINFKPKKS